MAPQPTFRFRLDGGAIFLVQAGACVKKTVAPGQHSVTELAESDYALVSIDVAPPGNIVGTDLPNRTATVTVPFAGNGGGETAVTFTNAVKTGQFKICKHVPLGSVDPLAEHAVQLLGVRAERTPVTNTFTPSTIGPITANGGCSNFTGFFPILNQNGTKKVIGIQEQGNPSGTWEVTDISLSQGGRGLCTNALTSCVPGGKDLTTGIIDFYLGPDQNIVDYTNRAK